LINASPEIRAQIEGFAPLRPSAGSARNTGIEGVLLTNADLDHTLGVVSLREGDAVDLHATEAMRGSLGWMETLLARFCGLSWKQPSLRLDPLPMRDGAPSGLQYRAIPLPSRAPRYRHDSGEGEAHAVAYEFADEASGARLLVAPEAPAFDERLIDALAMADAILFDGTFFTDDELQLIRSGARTAREMGHLPIQGGSLETLRSAPALRKMYVHINNTNPILDPGSPERAEVERAGMIVSEDGMEFSL
jgi:pyrroloquinoline quinone biosynthesis protein B